MIPRLIFVWFFSFSGTSYVVPIVLYNVKKVSNSNMHMESKTQNTKRRMETKNIHYFIFELKNPMKKVVSMSNDGSNLTKSRFGCFLRRSFHNSFLEHMSYFLFVKKLRKCCFWFGTYQKRFAVRDPESLNSIPDRAICFNSAKLYSKSAS